MTSPSCTRTPISYKTREFGKFSHKLRLYCIFFNVHVRNCLTSTYSMKSEVNVMFIYPSFLYNAGILAIHKHLRQKLDFQDLLAQNGGSGGNTEEGVVQCWPRQTCSYFWGLLFLCHFWRKSIKKCDCESADRDILSYWHMLWQKQTKFIICPMLYAIAMGQLTITAIDSSN